MTKQRDTITTHTTIPAEPGWFLCFRLNADDGDGYADEWVEVDIIAWEIERNSVATEDPNYRRTFRVVTPITLHDDALTGDYAIKRPDGHYYTHVGDRCSSVTELNEYYDRSRAEVDKQKGE
jgi:hypothetical protein